MRVYFDTEFTDFQQPALLSIGAVSQNGKELYLELDLSTPDGASAVRRMSTFVCDSVTPQFGLWPQSMPSLPAIGNGIADWLVGFNERIELVYDYKVDIRMLSLALSKAGRLNEVADVMDTPILFVETTEAAHQASEASLKASEMQGLFRHHALADARALRAAVEAQLEADEGPPTLTQPLTGFNTDFERTIPLR